MAENILSSSARLASLGKLRSEIIPNILTPVPSAETLRDWFDKGKVPRFKANPSAKRGGGPIFYSVSAVEKLIRERMQAAQGAVIIRMRGDAVC